MNPLTHGKLPRRAAPALFAFIMSAGLGGAMSAAVTTINTGLDAGSRSRWLDAWALAFALASAPVKILAPRVAAARRRDHRLTQQRRRTMFDTGTTIPTTFAIGGELEVNRIGFGAMRLTGQPGNFGPHEDWSGGTALLRRAYEAGVTFFDSARSYGPEWADRIVGEALGATNAVIATKGGVDKPAADRITVDGAPGTLRRQVEDALRNLRRDRIDLFQLHRVDPETPIEVSVAALAEMQSEGLIRHIGLSNVDQAQFERAMAVGPIASVQNRFNATERGADAMVDFTAEHGIAFIPYGPLGAHPMQAGAKLPPQEALAWLLKRSPNIVVIPGTTNAAHLDANVATWSAI